MTETYDYIDWRVDALQERINQLENELAVVNSVADELAEIIVALLVFTGGIR